MPKPQYTQKFRDAWLKDPSLKEWLLVIDSTLGREAKCKFCSKIITSHYADLKSHDSGAGPRERKYGTAPRSALASHNFPTLNPPKINSEVIHILSQGDVKRDQSQTRYQLLVAKTTSALGKCFNYVIEEINNNPESDLNKHLLPHLADAGSLTTRLLYEISMMRRDYIAQVLSKSVKETVKDTTPGEYLYGSDLGEKIKTAKIMEKTGNDLRSDSYYKNKAGPSGIKRGGGTPLSGSVTPPKVLALHIETSYHTSLNRQHPPRQSRRDTGSRKGQASKQRRLPVNRYR
ncbi:unnamed protein product [Acanthoscelides obtectus]|uniref:Uncharacterized protein n=1 Tax=Acanthoscelides obtectus TaxID=200917 RepID=A0A9P0M4X6_ACAOB|nr:unnamed protein product [Acanthoscelides obtectus]CAK1624191.1 hypothetical protein AOBTE_LOCUS2387 [Acanthoscelides obtectus]